MRVLVPEHTARFVHQLRATEGWHQSFGFPVRSTSRLAPPPA
jgi:hypothetical protein